MHNYAVSEVQDTVMMGQVHLRGRQLPGTLLDQEIVSLRQCACVWPPVVLMSRTWAQVQL
jgi:hypothetical protein